MFPVKNSHRALIAAGSPTDEALQQLFTHDALAGWQTVKAESFSRARFMLQHHSCDVVLVSDDLYEREGGQGLAWLASRRDMPLIYLAGNSGERLQKAYELGAMACLPGEMLHTRPQLLAAALEQALRATQTRLNYRTSQERLAESRLHVDRLVNMIWRTTPKQEESHWFSQRYMMERLSEELARVERHQVPLTLAIGTVELNEKDMADDGAMPDWAMDVIGRAKRRCDVAGQYGPGGFMLLMVHTPVNGGIQCCRRLQKLIEHPEQSPAGPHADLHAYFGLTSTAGGKLSSATLLRSAEESLDAARADAKERLAVA